jgi:tRNA-splicing ligase RtcB
MAKQTKDKSRIFQALSRDGLEVSQSDPGIYSVRLSNHNANTPVAEVLLPDELPLESKALGQLANLANVQHPDGGHIKRCCATPDFHPGDTGIAIGSVTESNEVIIPQAVGVDVCCGMRLHTTDMNLDQFLTGKKDFIKAMSGDYLLGTRDVVMSKEAMVAMFNRGVPAWLDEVKKSPLGSMSRTDLSGIESDIERMMFSGSYDGNTGHVPDELWSCNDVIRDEGLGTIGRGNHFVEIQVVEEILDKSKAYELGVKKRQIVFMIHSGSRNVGRHTGSTWHDIAKGLWPKDLKHPESKIFPISMKTNREEFEQYVEAERTASNYASVNRVILAELFQIRMREVFGDFGSPLIYDLPHNITLKEGDNWISRKGACPAHSGQPVIIPGSMGSASYLLVGCGSDRFLNSASHGAGRSQSRGSMNGKDEKRLGLESVECITLRAERRIEEAPAAYKDIGPVIEAQVKLGLVSVVAKMKPLLTFKA